MGWDECYANNQQMSVWPWTDLVRRVRRFCHIPPVPSSMAVLELGCGAGANIPFFEDLGVNYSAIEGSYIAVDLLHQRFPKLKPNITCGDFTKSLIKGKAFDLIFDRASVTHNNSQSIKDCMNSVYSHLKPGGIYIGSDWFSHRHSDSSRGKKIDAYTRSEIPTGQFKDIGNVHFANEARMREIFSSFRILLLEEKIYKNVEPPSGQVIACWDIVAEKI